jgi:drug/metabolite transporter (DMT)-like permease
VLRFHFSLPTFCALGAALLFGASMPFAKQLVGNFSPILLAGLLYLGSGIGLIIARLIRDKGWKSTTLLNKEWPWFLSAIGFGGVFAPILLMFGLIQSNAATASLLLNLEAVLTALLAWLVFKENADRRIIFGMILIVAGGIVLVWPSKTLTIHHLISPLLIAGACLCWALDNNLTRKISGSDPLFVAGIKGLVAGIINSCVAIILGATLPPWSSVTYALLVGLIGYGISLVLFILALRGLGTARTSAYFSTAPFLGAAIAILFFHESPSILFWIAAILMSLGVLLHLTERHEHEHTHEELTHEHLHIHDEHHQHEHRPSDPPGGSHSHVHHHKPITHKHPHYPDIHHRHKHK